MKRLLKKLWKPLKNNNGTIFPLVLCLVLCLLTLICVLLESGRLYTICNMVKESTQSAILNVVTANYDNTYGALREGYSGGYKFNGSAWEEKLYTDGVKEQLVGVLGASLQDGKIIKKGTTNNEYEISNINISIVNAPFQDNDSKNFIATAKIKVIVPLSYGFSDLNPLTLNLRTTAQWAKRH